MVKFSNPVHVDAHYEALFRTVGVSLKPAIGKELFDRQDVDGATGGSFASQFDTERHIYGKLRPYLLKSATHGQNAQSEIASLVNPSFSTMNNEGSIFSPAPDAISNRKLAERSSDLLKNSGHRLPSGIHEHVAASLLLQAGGQVQFDSTYDRVSESLESHSYDGYKIRCADNGFQLASGLSTASVSSLALLYNSATGIRSGLYFVNAVAGPSKTALLASREFLTSSLANAVHLCKEGGFGTAPIWYQQSMATGPPEARLAYEVKVDPKEFIACSQLRDRHQELCTCSRKLGPSLRFSCRAPRSDSETAK